MPTNDDLTAQERELLCAGQWCDCLRQGVGDAGGDAARDAERHGAVRPADAACDQPAHAGRHDSHGRGEAERGGRGSPAPA